MHLDKAPWLIYTDGVNNRPASNSPWFNAICSYSPIVEDMITTINRKLHRTSWIEQSYWLDEYHTDGFRFDFTKGFSNNSNNATMEEFNCKNAWLIPFRAFTWILCDFRTLGDNNEEKYIDYGMMLGKCNTWLPGK